MISEPILFTPSDRKRKKKKINDQIKFKGATAAGSLARWCRRSYDKARKRRPIISQRYNPAGRRSICDSFYHFARPLPSSRPLFLFCASRNRFPGANGPFFVLNDAQNYFFSHPALVIFFVTNASLCSFIIFYRIFRSSFLIFGRKTSKKRRTNSNILKNSQLEKFNGMK